MVCLMNLSCYSNCPIPIINFFLFNLILQINNTKEWEIPFHELHIGDAIGTGHFGTVYRGNWHGDVAIKVLNMNCTDDEKIIKDFKSDVNAILCILCNKVIV